MGKRDTRNRILLTALQLFNEQGEPNTTTNDIADEADISPGNLHYHFRRKSELIDALLAEFQADARKLLVTPGSGDSAVDQYWNFVHLLLETLAAYRFLFRDAETLRDTYPQVDRAMRGFAKGLSATTELHVHALRNASVLQIPDADVAAICRNLVVVTLFSDRFDTISGDEPEAHVAAIKIARSLMSILLPHAGANAAPLLEALTEQYR